MSTPGYRVLEKLRDGTVATIRAVRPDDKERVLRAFRALDSRSVYTRVFGVKKDLSAQELRRLTEPDPAKEAALVVTLGEGEGEVIIGGGRYYAAGASAEVAFTVEEDYQKLGIASRLLRHLARIAREGGLERLEAYVLPENAAMLGVFEHCGLPMQTKRKDGLVHVTLALKTLL